MATLLTEMDGVDDGQAARVVVVAMTNSRRPNTIKPTMRCSGCFDRELEIGVPGVEFCVAI